jgi:arginine N-succinyltransferase
MPKHPVYTAMLPETARAVMGVPHPSGRAAMRMLENEGFSGERYIDIFDAGPTMTVRTDAIRTIREAEDSPVVAILDGGEGEPVLAAHGRFGAFRSGFGQIDRRDGGVALDTDCAGLLGVGVGDIVSHIGRW